MYREKTENAQNDTKSVVQTQGGIIVSDSLSLLATKDRERLVATGDSSAPGSVLGTECNPLGNGEAEAESSGDLLSGDEPPMNVDAILAKWEAGSIGQDYRGRTKPNYRQDFMRFAKSSGLEDDDRKWLVKNGRRLIIEWVMALPEKSRATRLAGLQSVWTFGIPEVPWPVNKKRDFGRKVFPKVGHRACPEDSDIEPIFRAALREEDNYLRSFVLAGLSTGDRPGDQLGQFRWSDVRQCGRTLAIVAESMPGRKFKTNSPVIARLPMLASEALKAWKAETPYNAPDDWIWPRRPHGKLSNRKADEHSTSKEWGTFLSRHRITTWVRMANLRHWVELRQQEDRIPQVFVAYLRGHAVESATEGALGYSGNRRVEKILSDQETEWPDGPCGIFTATEVHVVDALAPYMAVMAEYDQGQMTTDEMARKMESVRLKLLKPAKDIVP
jgi:hypothetical protein